MTNAPHTTTARQLGFGDVIVIDGRSRQVTDVRLNTGERGEAWIACDGYSLAFLAHPDAEIRVR